MSMHTVVLSPCCSRSPPNALGLTVPCDTAVDHMPYFGIVLRQIRIRY